MLPRGHRPPHTPPAGDLRPTRLLCEYFENPRGIDVPSPRLFWKLESDTRGQRQTAYQILVAGTPEQLNADAADIWDSGKIQSDQSVFIPYSGPPLQSRRVFWWKVRVWDKDGRPSSYSDPAFWQMGILNPDEWRGQWIASDLDLLDHQKTLRALTDFGMEPETEIWNLQAKCRNFMADVTTAPAVYMRREFETTSPVRRATAYICGLGYHELHINGKKIGDHFLSPAYTDYRKRALYETFDVTSAIQPGNNAVGVILGNGWFNLITPHALRYYAADYIAPPRLRMEIDIEYADGSHQTVASDPKWKFTTDGPIRFNCVLAGETFDSRKDLGNWTRRGYDDRAWRPTLPAAAPEGELRSQMLPPVRVVTTASAVSVTRHDNGWRFDLGAESVGWARLSLKGRPGQEITIAYPGSDGHTFGRYQTCKYICKGEGVESYAPRFCFNGYRYVDVDGLDYEPKPSDLQSEVVCSDLARTGSFQCSDDRLNRLQKILIRTLRNYTVHLPADPTREKAGWTQDVHTVFPEHALNMMVAPTYIKWQRDFMDAVQADGYMPPVVPGRFDGPTINGPWWGGVIIYAPWRIYQFYGDKGILAESYPYMRKYFGYLQSIAKDGIIEWGLGDWMEVGSVRPKATPVPFTSTAAYFYFASIMSQTADLLGKPDDSLRYGEHAERIRRAFNRQFLNAETGQYALGSQTSQLLPLCLNLAPDDKRDIVLESLVEKIGETENHLSTGFIGTPMLLTGLSDLGRPDLAWAIATQTDYPSFIDAVLNRGNTVMKEDWKGGLVQMPALQGPIGMWFYHSLAGIRFDPESPGMKHVILKPETTGTLTWVKAHHDSLYGRISSHWKKDGHKFTWSVAIPPNTSATAHIPAARGTIVLENGKPLRDADAVSNIRRTTNSVIAELAAGNYTFKSRLGK